MPPSDGIGDAPARALVAARLAGRIAYRDRAGGEVGRERFEILRHAGGFGFRALCEMDDIGLIRDVTMAFDAAWRPLDGFCRVTQHGRTAAATWFGVTADAVVLEGQVRTDDGLARVSDRLQHRPLDYLGLHPLQGDALIVNCLPPGTAEGQMVAIQTVTNSHSPDGEERVGLHAISIELACMGRETVEVAAGRFAARRFAIRWRADWPAADLWVREEDSLFLLLRWSMIERWYELVAFEADGVLAGADIGAISA